MAQYLPAKAGDAGDVGSVSGMGRSPGEGNGNPLQYSCLLLLLLLSHFSHVQLCAGSPPGSPVPGMLQARVGCHFLLHSCLENPMDRGAWWATVHAASQTHTDTHTHTQEHAQYLSVPMWGGGLEMCVCVDTDATPRCRYTWSPQRWKWTALLWGKGIFRPSLSWKWMSTLT